VGNGHSAIDKLIALTTLRQYQNGGQVPQVSVNLTPQDKEGWMKLPPIPESVYEIPEDIEPSDPIWAQLLWQSLLTPERVVPDEEKSDMPPKIYLDRGQPVEEYHGPEQYKVLPPMNEDTNNLIKIIKNLQQGRNVI